MADTKANTIIVFPHLFIQKVTQKKDMIQKMLQITLNDFLFNKLSSNDFNVKNDTNHNPMVSYQTTKEYGYSHKK